GFDAESHAAEQIADAIHDAHGRMQPAGQFAAAGQRYIDGLGGQRLLQLRRFQHCLALIQHRGNTLLGIVDALAGLRAFFRREPAERLQLLGDHALLAQVAHARLIRRAQVLACGDGRFGLAHQLFEVIHENSPSQTKKGKDAGLSPLDFTGMRWARRELYDRLAWAFSTSLAKPVLSKTAMSARTLRSSWMLAFFRPFMKRL